MARHGNEIEKQLGLPPRINYNSSDSTNSGSVEETIRSLGTAGRIGLPAVASSVLSYLRGDPEETTEVVTPEVVAPEVVTPADTQTQEVFDLDTDDSIQSDEDVPVAIPQEEATVEPIESVKLDNAIDGAAEEALESVVQTDDEKYADDAQYQEFGIPTGQDDREVSVVTNKIVELGYLIRERALRAVNRSDNVEYVPTGPFRMLSGLTQIANLETVNKFLKQAVGYKASDFKNTGGVDPKLDVSKEGINWCAAFVNHILTELGADTLGKGEKGYNDYLRIRADAYKDYGQDIYTRKDGLENYGEPIDFNSMQEGDIILIDFDPPGKDGHGQVDHVGFWAGNNVLGQQEGFVSVIGGNQGPSDNFIDPALQGQEQYGVTIKRNTYRNANILGVRRITYDNDAAIIAEDQKSRDRMSIFHGLEPSAASFISTDEINASNAPRKSLTPQLRPDTLPTPTTDFEGNPIKTYAQGGLTSMDEQMQMAMNGQAETVDPVSGNDVPPGSLPEEVRDDIDAKLSEGEYVVPADVVRFFGGKYFEDLRTEAKMGLQQMDADGRIGGEPVPAQGQDDSMDVAKLKAALSSSGMYAGGLTDGDSLDNFIDDASRDPMVNGRMRAGGATVKMAVGGLVPTGTYGDVTKVDSIIKQLMTAANNDPNLMQKLSDKGIMVNKTGADKKSAEMQQANKPQEPLKADEGTFVSTDPFSLENYDNLGSNIFDAAGIEDPLKAIEDTFLDSKGVIEQIVLIGPDGMEIPVAWNSAMPIPPGFTKKATNEYGGTKPVASAASVNNSLVRRNTGDDSNSGEGGGEPTTTSTGSSFSYTGANLSALEKRYEKSRRNANLSNLALAIPVVGGVIKTAIQANSAIERRRIKNELERREKLSVDELGNYDPEGNSFTGSDGKKTNLKEFKSKVSARSDKKGLLNFLVGPVVDEFFDKAAESKDKKAAADLIQEEVMKPLKGSGFEDSGLPAAFSDSFLSSNQNPDVITDSLTGKSRKVKSETGLEKITRLKQEQQVATSRRLERERKEREAREAAQRAAQRSSAAYNADVAAAQRRIEQANRSNNRDDSNDFDLGSSLGTDTDTDYGATDYGTISSGGLYQEGGLVSMPAAKKKKKQKTQRRKGLGTRP